MVPYPRTYQYYKSVFKGEPMPFAFVDMDLFNQNIEQVKLRAGNKPIRIASKSIRCVHLIKHILDYGAPYSGIMPYTASEALFLANQGFDNLLVGYPTCNSAEIAQVCEAVKQGINITLMADAAAHLSRYAEIAQKTGTRLPVCLDIDMSSVFPGLYFGVYRSSLHQAEEVKKLVSPFLGTAHLAITGIMGYEAQIAGVGDAVSGATVKNALVKTLKKQSVAEIAKRRAAVVQTLTAMGIQLTLVNGGGTGSLETTVHEDVVTEITVGSAFYSPALFDNYAAFKHEPAAAFAIEITRQPQPHIYTCLGGGYIASGSAGTDKLPKPYLPAGAQLIPNEGAGEVQTPFIYKGMERLTPGDPAFFRHAKAGELCERFTQLLLVSDGKIINRVPTYRGQNRCFV
ncbi:MAG TPA: amino acid deaminase/aldolase [Chitinophagales bacterium]|nr:amino acid deaminase/aldolase [Chitinophagales bacterium]HRK27281.1 amino acid deaminase/aldolase [Chitinophagales bacterium]